VTPDKNLARRNVIGNPSKTVMTNEELQVTLAQTQQALAQANAKIEWMETSKFWKLRLSWLRLRKKVITPPLHALNAPIAPPAPLPYLAQGEYARWRQQHEPRPADLQKMAETIAVWPHQPLISVIVPVYNPPAAFLREAIESVINQIYPHWELCIADDASPAPHVREILAHYQAQDSRIKVTFRETNGHISHCSNSALELATGEFIALLDHDDLLTPEALYEVALMINRHPTADMIYSDEDKLDEAGIFRDPFFKPDWSPDSFMSSMYTCHLGVYRRSLITAIGGFRAGFEGSQDYDLVLRLTEQTSNIFHIPQILYHWRIHRQSAASGADAKPYAYQAAEKALQEALSRRHEPGQVRGIPGYMGRYCIRYGLRSQPPITIIIPTKDLSGYLDKCLNSIFTKSTYTNFEVLVIDNNSVEPSTHQVFQRWMQKEPQRFRVLPLNEPFNFSRLNNFAVSHTQNDYLVFLNNDTEVITPDWLEAMLEQAQRPQIGAVGGLLLYPDDTIQHAGVVIGLGGVAGHSYQHSPANVAGYFGRVVCPTNVSAVTAACLMCRRAVFEQIGGFDEVLAVAFNDVDLCLKMVDKDYYNIYLPHVKLYHHESKSRGYEDTPEKLSRFRAEVFYMQRKWKPLIEHDPCYSPCLTRTRGDYGLNL
jgi:O-antigen biosynthesis protein